MIIAADGFNKRLLRFGKIIPTGRYYIKLTNGQRMRYFIVAHIVVVVEYHPNLKRMDCTDGIICH